jgi:hypothetical protein
MKKISFLLLFVLFFGITLNKAEASQYERVHKWVRAGARTHVIKLEPKPIEHIEVSWRDGHGKHALGQLYLGDLAHSSAVWPKYGFAEEIPDHTFRTFFDGFPQMPYEYLQIGIEDENAYMYFIDIHYAE